MVGSRGSRGLPRWMVVVGGVLLGLALVVAYVANNLPPDTREMMLRSYARGYEVGSGGKAVSRGEVVRRTPLQAPAGR